MRELWERIERWFAEKLPGVSLALRGGATEEEILAAESRLGVRFPDDYRASLLVHDGQDDEPGVLWLPCSQRLGSLESLVGCWEDDRTAFDPENEPSTATLDAGERVHQIHFHPKHVPIAGSPFWDYDRLLLDLEPGPKGTAGQVIARRDIDLVVVTTSFRELLQQIALGLESGRIVVGNQPADPRDPVEVEWLSPNRKRNVGELEYFG